MNKQFRTMLSIIIMLLCISLFCVRLTGVRVHIVLGVLLVIISIRHICKYYVIRKGSSKKHKIIYDMLIISLILIVLSGIMIHIMKQYPWIIGVHATAGIWFLCCTIIHIYQSKKLTKQEAFPLLNNAKACIDIPIIRCRFKLFKKLFFMAAKFVAFKLI